MYSSMGPNGVQNTEVHCTCTLVMNVCSTRPLPIMSVPVSQPQRVSPLPPSSTAVAEPACSEETPTTHTHTHTVQYTQYRYTQYSTVLVHTTHVEFLHLFGCKFKIFLGTQAMKKDETILYN